MHRGVIHLIAIVALSACSKRTLEAMDGGGGQGGSAIDAAPAIVTGADAAAEKAADAAAETAVRDTGAEAPPDVPVEMPPPPGSIPCDEHFCDASRMFCVHFTTGIAAGRRACYPLPSNCVGHGDDCACVAPGNNMVCSACRVVTGIEVTGIERDCPGPID
jgi:hypothetical protein